MRVRRLILTLALGLPAGGCNVLQIEVRTTQPQAVCCADDFHGRWVYRQAPAPGGYTYAAGFRDGFRHGAYAATQQEPPYWAAQAVVGVPSRSAGEARLPT